jgi:hypothetical protein
MQLVYRPSVAQAQHFALPMALQHSYTNTTQDQGAAAATSAAGSAAHRRSSTERRVSAAGSSHSSKPGSAVGSSKAAAGAAAGAAAAAAPPKLAVPVEAAGEVPKVILSRSALDFGSKVARRALQGGRSLHAFDVQLRNNTDGPVLVAVGPPGAPDAFAKPSSSHSTTRADTSKQQAAAKGAADVAASSAYAVEGWDTRASAAFVTLGPDEELRFTVRFTPREARVYEAVVPIYLDGSKSAPYMLVQLTGTGMLPRLTFDVADCVLPMVSLVCLLYVVMQSFTVASCIAVCWASWTWHETAELVISLSLLDCQARATDSCLLTCCPPPCPPPSPPPSGAPGRHQHHQGVRRQ